MENKCCTFAGHRMVTDNINESLVQTIIDLVENKGVTVFYVGNHGEFDKLSANTVRQVKSIYKDKKIDLILVLPKMRMTLNERIEYYEKEFDDVLIPAESDAAHYKSMITVRNRWMVEHSDYIIVYIRRDHGGAYSTYKYAKKQQTEIIEL